jgi:SAM-dependent methyltransferase
VTPFTDANRLASEAPEALETTACNLCGEAAFETVYRACRDLRHWLPGEFDVVRCAACGLVRTNPRPTTTSISAYYPESYVCFTADERPQTPLYSVLRTAVRLPYRLRFGLDDRTEHPKPGANRLLDIGCGTGLYLQEMVELGWIPWGIEPSAASARRAVERLGIPEDRVFVGTAEEAEFPDASFDLVTMAHVLEHLHEPRRVLAMVHRWLLPGGRVRIWAPNFASIERRVFGRFWFGLDVPRHLYHFTPRTLRLLLEKESFSVERIAPQYQANTLAWSIPHVLDGLMGRRREFRGSLPLYYAALPPASLLLGLGIGGALDAIAVKR